MYEHKKVGKYTVGIAQTGAGWNVSTYAVKNNRVKTYSTQNFRTLAAAKKEYTSQTRRTSQREEISKRQERKPVRRQQGFTWGF